MAERLSNKASISRASRVLSRSSIFRSVPELSSTPSCARNKTGATPCLLEGAFGGYLRLIPLYGAL